MRAVRPLRWLLGHRGFTMRVNRVATSERRAKAAPHLVRPRLDLQHSHTRRLLHAGHPRQGAHHEGEWVYQQCHGGCRGPARLPQAVPPVGGRPPDSRLRESWGVRTPWPVPDACRGLEWDAGPTLHATNPAGGRGAAQREKRFTWELGGLVSRRRLLTHDRVPCPPGNP